MIKTIAKFVKDESGATAIEYGLIAALIAVAIITAALTVGTQLDTIFKQVGSELSNATSASQAN